MSEVRLSPDGERAFDEAENLARRMNLAIQAPEHLLGGALVVLSAEGRISLTNEEIEEAIAAIHGRGSEPFKERVMPGPGMRAALNLTAGAVAISGGTIIDALVIARGTIASGEVNPMFYGSLGTTKDDLIALLDNLVEPPAQPS